MKKHFAIITVMLVLLAAAGNAFAIEQKIGRLSYAMGMKIGSDFRALDLSLDPAQLAKGIQDAMGGATRMTNEEMIAALQELQAMAVDKQMDTARKLAEKNLAKEKVFLTENGARPEVTTLPSGLQYEVITEGTGRTPSADDVVVVDYVGSFIDGKVFDSSIARGEPATFSVNGIIRGWTEALQLMKEGSKWKLYVPAELAYGEAGSPPVIEPNTTLVFEVELKSIQ